MNVSRRALVLAALTAPGHAAAQGFAGLGQDAEGYRLPQPGTSFAFPADHGAHPRYRIEWWYLTSNLAGADGTDYGIQWTLFRSALAPDGPSSGWATPQAWLAHAALTTPDIHHAAERLARGGIGQAGVRAEPFAAWLDDWSIEGPSLSDIRVTARADSFAYDLSFEAGGPFVPQGDGGYSVKSAAGQASYYYSQPFYEGGGTLTVEGREIAVTGRAWLDREWSSQPLAEDQTGWDWFSLHLDTGDKVMGFLLRSTDGGSFSSATWIAPDGTPTPFGDGHFAATPRGHTRIEGARVPTDWTVTLPDRGLDARVIAINPDALNRLGTRYWEGPVRVSGSHGGIGYLEMTGYV